MSAILRLINECEWAKNNIENSKSIYEKLGDAALDAEEDIQRLVSWVESAEHKPRCAIYGKYRNSPFTIEIVDPEPCDCGLDEIQSLLRS